MSKAKGSRAERELLHLFDKSNWSCIRTAGSGSTTIPATDLLAAKNARVLAIECKSGDKDTTRYLDIEQISELKKVAKKFGAEPLVAVRFDTIGWFFLKPEQLAKSKNNVPYFSFDLAKKKGISFKELIK